MDINVEKNLNIDSHLDINLPQLWRKSLEILQRELSEQSFKTWILPVQPKECDQNKLTLEVPDKFYRDWLKEHYQEIIKQAVFEASGFRFEISYKVSETPLQEVSLRAPVVTAGTSSGSAPRQDPSSQTLNGRYKFSDFVVGPGNRFAHAAALAISEAPARNYNPLFLYGNVGLGKTHLMQAIAHHILDTNPDMKVTYMSGEKFTNQLISAIQTRSTHQFRMRYRHSDILLVDDIHFIAGKESTQEEFFHTFNALYDAHKQIVVTSDRPPKEIPGLEDRLISRFGWGLVADIQPPDFETRVAILKKKMEKETVSVPDDVVFFIASKIKSNIRELEGALIRVVAYASLTGAPVNKKIVENEILRDSIKEERVNVTIDKIQRCVCDYFGIKISDLRVKRRSRSIAYPRQIAMYLVRALTDHSLPEIGAYFGGRGHATVIHACNKIELDTKKNNNLPRILEEIKELIKES